MRKIYKMFTTILFIIFLTSCGSSNVPSSINSENNKEKNESIKKQESIFRNVTFGMNLEEVKRSEDAKIVKETKNVLGYETIIATYQTTLAYYFNENNELYGIRFGVTNVFNNKDSYKEAYNKIKQALIDKYGQPDPNFIDKPFDDAIIGCFWDKEDYSIKIMFKEVQEMTVVMVELTSKNIKPLKNTNGL